MVERVKPQTEIMLMMFLKTKSTWKSGGIKVRAEGAKTKQNRNPTQPPLHPYTLSLL